MSKNLCSVTVVIPCWRSKETINRAVESIYYQSMVPAKVILVDDASGDGTAQHLAKMQREFPDGWIDVIQLKENSGPGVARNAGWNEAKTTYIAFLDADDAWHPRKIELQYNWMCKHPDMAITGHASELFNEVAGFKKIETLSKPKQFSYFSMVISNRMITRSVMLKTELSFRFGGKSVTEDYLLWLEMVASNIPMLRFDEPLAVSFRPEFSAGGYSGDLWRHEKRELNAILKLYQKKKINLPSLSIFSAWSLVKYGRRFLLNCIRSV